MNHEPTNAAERSSLRRKTQASTFTSTRRTPGLDAMKRSFYGTQAVNVNSGTAATNNTSAVTNESTAAKVESPEVRDNKLRDRIAFYEVGLEPSIFNKSDDEFSDWYKNEATSGQKTSLSKMGYNPEKNVFSPYRVTNAQGQVENKLTSGIGQYGEGYGDRSAMDVYTGFHDSADKHIAKFKSSKDWLYNSSIDDARLGVLEELSFNMGSNYAREFPSMFDAIKRAVSANPEDADTHWAEAARQLKYVNPNRNDTNSKWFRDVGKRRANKLLAVLLTGNEDADPLISDQIKAKSA